MDRLLLFRRAVQALMLIALPVFPLLGWVRVDVASGSLALFSVRIWAHEANLVVLAVAFSLAVLAGLAAVGGRLFCGWMCPQTALSEFSAYLHSVVSRSLRGGSWPAKVVMLLVGAGVAATLSAVGGLAIVTFFVPTFAFATLLGPPVNTSLLKGISIATILVFVLVFVFRHMFCEWICLFGWWQRLFVSGKSLRIGFDTGRSKACTNCGACRKVCFMKLEPRQRRIPSTCLNCAKCVSACAGELGPLGLSGLIKLGFLPSAKGQSTVIRRALSPANGRLAIALSLVAVTGIALATTSASRQPVQLVVRQGERLQVDDDELKGSFHVEVYNNLSRPVVLELEQDDFEESEAKFSPSHLIVGPRGRGLSDLSIEAEQEKLAPGRHTLIILASSDEMSGRAVSSSGRVVFIVPPMMRSPKISQEIKGGDHD